jgi:UDP-glucose 4-epimerase
MFADIARSGPLRVLSLRYFNPIGADPKLRTGYQLSRPAHAIAKMIEATKLGTAFPITGTDYPTRDGSAIRDYVHVWDLARAHVLALSKFDELVTNEDPYEVINLGTDRGTTVKELIVAFNKVSSVQIQSIEMPRREGDVSGIYASNERARRLLGWIPNHSLADGIKDSLRWAEFKHNILGD